MDQLMPSLGLRLSNRGKQPEYFSVAVERELTWADVMAREQAASAPRPRLKEIRTQHHFLARTLAGVKSVAEASAITGFSPQRITLLKSDPSFQELLEFYQHRADVAFEDVIGRLSATGLSAVEEIARRLEEEPEKVSMADLVRVASLGLDRAGHGPTSKVQVLTAHLTKEDLDEMKARVNGETIIRAKEGEEPSERLAVEHRSVGETTVERVQSERKNLRESRWEEAEEVGSG